MGQLDLPMAKEEALRMFKGKVVELSAQPHFIAATDDAFTNAWAMGRGKVMLFLRGDVTPLGCLDLREPRMTNRTTVTRRSP